MKRRTQVSESLVLGILLAISGGFMDAYSYMFRGEVFANAQTGNILLFGVNLSRGNWMTAAGYFIPVMFFTLGIALSAFSRFRLKERSISLHWRQITVGVEAVVLLFVAWIPTPWNLLANSLISFACGIQVESFNKIHGKGIATTMCIGNLRSGTDALCAYIETGEKADARKAMLYFGIIFFFVTGAVLGNLSVTVLGARAILVCSGLLFTGFLMMFYAKEES